jgi:hypothetical protein
MICLDNSIQEQTMTDRVENQLIAELSRRVVADVAPDERRAFNAISESYFKNPEQTLKGEGGEDELLGWGVAEIAILLTPIILEVAKEVLKDLLKDSVKESIKENSPVFIEKVKIFFKQLFGSDSSQPVQAQYLQFPLSEEQLKQAHQRARERALLLGVEVDKATLIANSVIASLQLPL